MLVDANRRDGRERERCERTRKRRDGGERERRGRKMNGNRIEKIRLGAVMWLWAQQLPAQ